MAEIMTLSNITALKFAAKTANMLRSMTFLYDANWSPDGTNSLPFAFFHVTKQEELLRNDVSTKRVILHEFNPLTATPTGALSVISDNIVPQPKIYKLQVMVPMFALFPFVDEVAERIETGMRFMSTASKGLVGDSDFGTIGSVDLLDSAANVITVFRLLLRLFSVSTDVLNYFLQDMSIYNVSDYNKDSLEAMCRNRAILRMKEWSGWTYKYGVITSCSLSKEPLNEQYYTGTIELQEMPIMSSNAMGAAGIVPKYGIMQTAFLGIKPVIEGVLLR